MKKCLFLVMAVAAFATGFTLCSCGGGGGGGGAVGSNGAYTITAKQFASGSKHFLIRAQNMWFVEGGQAADGVTMSPTEVTSGAANCYGTVSLGQGNAAKTATMYMHYVYRASEQTATLTMSWNVGDRENELSTALTNIVSIHNIAEGGGEEEGGNANNHPGGIGEEGNPLSSAEHYGPTRIEFDFKTGTCIMYCACGAATQTLPFDVVTQ